MKRTFSRPFAYDSFNQALRQLLMRTKGEKHVSVLSKQSISNADGSPNMPNNIPNMPQMPQMPQMPNMGNVPNMGNMPNMPNMGNMPNAAGAVGAAGALGQQEQPPHHRIEQFLQSTGQFMQTAQTYAPYVQQAMPMLKTYLLSSNYTKDSKACLMYPQQIQQPLPQPPLQLEQQVPPLAALLHAQEVSL